MNAPQIVGICQVRNEDVFLGQILANVAAFCDRVLVADHQSRDRTGAIAAEIAGRSATFRVTRIGHPAEAHEMIRVYANTPTWIFPVDGDEVYDPVGLAQLRTRIRNGDFSAYRQLYGHSLHCTELDRDAKRAKGYLTPPSRTVTKLYNFDAITDWAGPCTEKCLGGTIHFKPGFSAQSNLNLVESMSWEESPFRLLHMCFLRRSSLDPDQPIARPQVGEIYETPLLTRVWHTLRRQFGKPVPSAYKKEKYMRGPIVERDVSAFFPPPEVP